MCGLVGFCGLEEGSQTLRDIARSMADSVRHRGPDDSGVFVDQAVGLGLGHRRLAILDLSPLGHQPMASICGRYFIVFNGEIYNHLELREELEALGHAFRGGSDTETMLAAFVQWGVEAAVGRFVGMFAFALWDRELRECILVRDRLGIKPLYYSLQKQAEGTALLFGSELKALRCVPGFDDTIDRDALALYFRHNYIPSPHSIYKGARKLPPGTILRFAQGQTLIQRYWDVRDVWAAGAADPLQESEKGMIEGLEGLLLDAVGKRMLADVPLGAFLSGGVDSSAVVALMQSLSGRPVKTFAIGFGEAEFDEASYAAQVARHLGTEHTEMRVSPADMLQVIPDLPLMWDEPFADSSQVPTYILSKLTRGHVTVSLSGDGGDELFCGYERYFWTNKVWRAMQKAPRSLRVAVSSLASLLPDKAFDLLGGIGQKVRWRLDALNTRDIETLYRFFISHFKNPDTFVLGATEPDTVFGTLARTDDAWSWMSLHDILGYLPDDILTKVDRASMAVGLEARVPLLDHRVVEFAARTPLSFKVRGGKGKWLLRQVLYRHVPKELIERPKMGFGVPIERWMRNELREWCGDLLNTDTLRRQGYLDADKVARMWKEYLSGESNWHYYLWDVLMFQAWLEAWGKD
jgi:asparagine synthase (glutamine-hydrolysing)